MAQDPGVLYVVATPIGNLGDLAPRVREVLAGAAVIAAEDTRRCRRLLSHLGITQTTTISLHEHNEAERTPGLIGRLRAGDDIALVSDAGTPLVSDPGFLLVRAAREAGLPVRSVPGACAAIAALAVSGLPPDRFVFEGFLPSKPAARRTRLAELARVPHTLIVYESSHRIAATVSDLAAVLGGERRLCLARELTKRHEESVTLTAVDLCDWLAADPDRTRGEFVLVVQGAEAISDTHDYRVDIDTLLSELLHQLSPAQSARLASRVTGAPRNRLYRKALELGSEPGPDS